MSIKAVLFDLDGTLLPMDQDLFTKVYFKGLTEKLAPCGYEPKKLIESVWLGTKAMVKNDGTKTNEKAFWDTFSSIYGKKALEDYQRFEEFYEENFADTKSVCGFEPLAKRVVDMLHSQKIRTVVATNPIFPAVAINQRITWTELSLDDFELVTTYENIGFSKPNTAYYLEIAKRLGVEPSECIMVGNDALEDMIAAEVGMKVFLLTDNLINKTEIDISGYPQGNFENLIRFLEKTI